MGLVSLTKCTVRNFAIEEGGPGRKKSCVSILQIAPGKKIGNVEFSDF